MPSLKTALVQRLLTATSINSKTGRRIHWNNVPQGTPLPYVCLRVISDNRPIHLEGFDGSRETRVQADCYAVTNQAADAIAQAIITEMLPPTTSETGGRFGRTRSVGPHDLSEVVEGIAPIHRANVDLLIRHTFP